MTEPAPNPIEPSQPAAPSPAAELRRLHETALQRQRAGDLQGAIECYNQCLERAPNLADAYNNLAVLLKTAKRLPAAIACLRRAVGLAPQQSAFHSNLGNVLWLALEFDEAMASFQRALALDANRPETYHNLGLLHFSLGNFPAAIECYDRSLALKPEAGLVRWDRALALLASGDYGRGFAAFDERFDLTDPSMGFDRKLQNVKKVLLPLWNGEALAGRTLYLYTEQGFGDTLQFVRFIPLVAQSGARIIFDCPNELLRLVAGFPGIAELRGDGHPLPAADFHLPLMSLPGRLGVTLGTVPARVPYLAPPPASAGAPLPRPPGSRLGAGICWAGRPHHANDHNRSIAFEHFLELCDLPGLTLYSLQKGPRAGDIAELCAQALVRDLSPQIQDFADTARFIQQLDLVITADTAVAHLAGALGRPVLVLLPFTPDWRWLGRREDSPWYPTLRLIRQPAPRDWKTVMRRVHDMLAGTLATRR
ncbi:MAG TPA: tetratricopeptide repeat protein [Stellaceae bacterium]|nr:tetratricopeptide repeat protein [Stellaceae bacterium]